MHFTINFVWTHLETGHGHSLTQTVWILFGCNGIESVGPHNLTCGMIPLDNDNESKKCCEIAHSK